MRRVWLRDAAGRRTPDVLVERTGTTGAQGSVWLLGERADLVAKIVRDADPLHLAARLDAMLNAPRADGAGPGRLDVRSRDGSPVVAWPVATVHRHDDDRLLGYAAPRLGPPRYLPLPMLFGRTVRTRALPGTTWGWWLSLAEDLARAVHHVHECGHVVGDLAPANLFAAATARVVLIDADGWQLHDARTGVHLPCPFSRPEHTAPEHLDEPGTRRAPASDRWSLAVVLLQLLYLGFHPFGGVPDGPAGTGIVAEEHNVRARRCWLLGTGLRTPRAVPPVRLLPPVLRDRLHAAVVDGYDRVDRRPLPLDWAAALAHTRRRLVTCPRQPLHVYPPEAAPCPWCTATAAGAPDPFPVPTRAAGGPR